MTRLLTRHLTRHLSRVVALVAVLSLAFAGYAFAAHLTTTSTTLGAGSTAVTGCMPGSTITFSDTTDATGQLTSVEVGNIAESCATGTLEAALAGTAAHLPYQLTTGTTIDTTNCPKVSTLFTCTFAVTPATTPIKPATVARADASITGP